MSTMRSLLCFALACLAVAHGYDCPPGYTFTSLTQNNVQVPYCYKPYITFFNRQQAVARCAEDQATLASITSPEENQMYVNSDQVSGSLTFGLSCYDSGHCVFDDGTPFNRSLFNGFSGGEVRADLGQCVELETLGVFAGKWSNIPCTMLGSFVCRYKPNTCSPQNPTNTNGTQQSGCNNLHLLTVGGSPVTGYRTFVSSGPLGQTKNPDHFWSKGPARNVLPPVTVNLLIAAAPSLNVSWSRSGEITSPNYPGSYDNLQTCSYFIQSNTRVNITFTDFSTEGGYDLVRVNNGGYRQNATLLGEYSGPRSPFTVITQINEALITFTTDSSHVERGFSALVSAA